MVEKVKQEVEQHLRSREKGTKLCIKLRFSPLPPLCMARLYGRSCDVHFCLCVGTKTQRWLEMFT